jgi:hypothetical protein
MFRAGGQDRSGVLRCLALDRRHPQGAAILCPGNLRRTTVSRIAATTGSRGRRRSARSAYRWERSSRPMRCTRALTLIRAGAWRQAWGRSSKPRSPSLKVTHEDLYRMTHIIRVVDRDLPRRIEHPLVEWDLLEMFLPMVPAQRGFAW